MYSLNQFAGYDPAADNVLFSNAKGKKKDKDEPSRREKKKAAKFGVNPVTGAALSRRQFKRVKKTGFDTETGLIMSKKQGKKEYGNVGTRRARSERRGEVQTVRAETGNTFGNSIANIVQSVKGQNVPEPQQTAYQDEYEQPEQYEPAPPSRPPINISGNPGPLQYQEQNEPEYMPLDNVRMTAEALEARDNPPLTPGAAGNKKTMLYIGIGLAVLVVVAFGFKLLKK